MRERERETDRRERKRKKRDSRVVVLSADGGEVLHQSCCTIHNSTREDACHYQC